VENAPPGSGKATICLECILLLLYYTQAYSSVIQQSMSLKYEPRVDLITDYLGFVVLHNPCHHQNMIGPCHTLPSLSPSLAKEWVWQNGEFLTK